jgi:hypothetical protein
VAYKIPLSAEWRRALGMLANAGERGITRAVLLARGFTAEMVESLVLSGLAIANAKTLKLGNQRIKAVRLRITNAGRYVLMKQADHLKMADSPIPQPPQSWDIYLARHTPAKWVGTVEAVDFDTAIEEATQRFEVENSRKLLVVRRGSKGPSMTTPSQKAALSAE